MVDAEARSISAAEQGTAKAPAASARGKTELTQQPNKQAVTLWAIFFDEEIKASALAFPPETHIKKSLSAYFQPAAALKPPSLDQEHSCHPSGAEGEGRQRPPGDSPARPTDAQLFERDGQGLLGLAERKTTPLDQTVAADLGHGGIAANSAGRHHHGKPPLNLGCQGNILGSNI